jgi:hypothetical protein
MRVLCCAVRIAVCMLEVIACAVVRLLRVILHQLKHQLKPGQPGAIVELELELELESAITRSQLSLQMRVTPTPIHAHACNQHNW